MGSRVGPVPSNGLLGIHSRWHLVAKISEEKSTDALKLNYKTVAEIMQWGSTQTRTKTLSQHVHRCMSAASAAAEGGGPGAGQEVSPPVLPPSIHTLHQTRKPQNHRDSWNSGPGPLWTDKPRLNLFGSDGVQRRWFHPEETTACWWCGIMVWWQFSYAVTTPNSPEF